MVRTGGYEPPGWSSNLYVTTKENSWAVNVQSDMGKYANWKRQAVCKTVPIGL